MRREDAFILASLPHFSSAVTRYPMSSGWTRSMNSVTVRSASRTAKLSHSRWSPMPLQYSPTLTLDHYNTPLSPPPRLNVPWDFCIEDLQNNHNTLPTICFLSLSHSRSPKAAFTLMRFRMNTHTFRCI